MIATVTTDFGGQVLTAFADTVWVSSTDFNTVQRIDPATNEVIVTIDTESHPDGMLGVDGVMWVATDFGPLLFSIDPATNEPAEGSRWHFKERSMRTSCSSPSTATSGSRSSRATRSFGSPSPPRPRSIGAAAARSVARIDLR